VGCLHYPRQERFIFPLLEFFRLNPKKNAGLRPIGIGATPAFGIGKLYAAVVQVFQCKTRSSRA
jgi:hypothetical protein